jgi:hypothetical protein
MRIHTSAPGCLTTRSPAYTRTRAANHSIIRYRLPRLAKLQGIDGTSRVPALNLAANHSNGT